MKILVLGDLHAGEKDGSLLMMEHQLKILSDVIEYIQENNIERVFLTGDVFDVRKATNTNVLSQWKERFYDVLYGLGVEVDIIVGNHDAMYKNTLTPNTVHEHLSWYKNINIYSTPTEVQIDGVDFLMLPWICKENEEKSFEKIKNSESQVVMAHPEIVGASMGGSVCEEGLALSEFDRFELVIAGHFHAKGVYQNVTYVGTPYELTWIDYGEDKGFHIYDTDDKSFTFHKLDNPLFFRFTYDEDKDMSYVFDLELKDKYIKLIIENRADFEKYEKFLDRLQTLGMQDLKIVEPLMGLDAKDSVVEFNGELEIKSTEALIEDYILDLYPEKSKGLTKLMLGLHAEARSD